jgi:hypothetical protein
MKLFNNIIDNIITKLGKSNDSEIVTATLAAFKLIFIPISTMSDKKTSKEQKEYAIKRDLFTEIVALAGYVGITKAVKNNLTAPICKKYYSLKAKELNKAGKLDINSEDFKILNNACAKSIKASAMDSLPGSTIKRCTNEQKENIKKLENVVAKFADILQKPNDLYLNTKKTISHACVCILALTIIPFITNKILALIANSNTKKDIEKQKPQQKTTYSVKIPTFTQYGSMVKIGGPKCL